MNLNKKHIIYGSAAAALLIGITATSVFLYKKKKNTGTTLSEGITNYFGKSGMLGSSYPRGVRNNNPGNLVKTNISWKGKLTNNTDGHFEQFTSYIYGIRAMLIDVISDFKKGKKTIRSIINEYSPSTENDTESYISSVAKVMGIAADKEFSMSKTNLKALAVAIIKIENGLNSSGKIYMTNSQFEKAYSLI